MSFFQEGMKKDFCVVKLVGKGGDSLLESGENAAGERVTQMVNIWMRTMWCGAQNLVLFCILHLLLFCIFCIFCIIGW